MFRHSRPKGETQMLGLRSPVSILASLTVIAFSLLTAVIASGQTPATPANKPVAELSASLPKPAPATSPASRDAAPVSDTTAKLATESPIAETESVKPETPATTTAMTPTTATTAAAPAMQQCTRTIKADVVAIPQPIMLNRLGATIPNAFVFAL